MTGSESGNELVTFAGMTPPRPANQGEQNETTVSLAEMKILVEAEAAVIVDARSPQRYEMGHIAGAINVPAQGADHILPDAIRMRGKGVPVIVYCESPSCPYASQVARRLRAAQVEPVLVFEGGWEQWQRR